MPFDMVDPYKRFLVRDGERLGDSLADKQRGDKAWFSCRCEYVDVCNRDICFGQDLVDQSEYMVGMESSCYFWYHSLCRDMLYLRMCPHSNELFISQKGNRCIVTG